MQRTAHVIWTALCMGATVVYGLCWPAGASVLRCQTADGRISYQDSSCPDGARAETVDTTPNRGFRFADEQQISRAMRPPPEERLRPVRNGKAKARVATNAGERRFITSGLTSAEVRHRIGAPDSIANSSATSGRKRSKGGGQRWVYLPAPDDPQTTTTLTLKGGVVTHVERKVTR